MKNKTAGMLAAVIALGGALTSQAAQLIVINSWADESYRDTNGIVTSAAGYVATLWWGYRDSTDPLSFVQAGVMDENGWWWGDDSKYPPGDEALLTGQIMAEKGAPIYTEVRIFQYTPGEAIQLSDLYGVPGQVWGDYWDLIQGTQVSQAWVGGYATLNSVGGPTMVSGAYDYVTNPAVMKGIPGTLAVPESATYAALGRAGGSRRSDAAPSLAALNGRSGGGSTSDV
ncbi:MAG: putative globular PEP-CTERM protein [Opitutaceae bacterium]|nr:putative globular PEP-CTERM protein [Opitutaceae bacterium]